MATIKEIAELAGVSRGTVDRVLNKRGAVNPKTEAKILEIAQSYGLKVNITTNGTLLKKQLDAILSYPPHQINMSFHSAGDNVTVDFDRYVRELFEAIRTIHSQTDTQMSLRLWASHGKLDMF